MATNGKLSDNYYENSGKFVFKDNGYGAEVTLERLREGDAANYSVKIISKEGKYNLSGDLTYGVWTMEKVYDNPQWLGVNDLSNNF